ncbi:MAG: T9SS type A sorting domain-containing protein [Chryseobacterium sp.]|nr:T9SS type A sorting domain-containing protein [Chryseobacterium sp.]MDN5475928.1 T9SS type A sorting domain-containing protein [Chryseobacterium sp.]
MITTQFFTLLKRVKPGMIAAFVLFVYTSLDAQVISSYSFSQNQGTYIPISNSTNIAKATASTGSGVLDDNVYPLNTVIPFSFPFNGSTFNSIKVHANGFISFGSPVTSSSDPIGSGTAYAGVVSPLSADLQSLFNVNGLTGSIDYTVAGSAPNREFIVQWSHFRPYSSTAATSTSHHDWNFQARLHENGSIRYVYSMASQGSPNASSAKVGLRGATNSDYNNRAASGNASSNWNNTVSGTNSSAGITTNYSFLPTQGLTFTWIAPTACIVPVSQASNLALTNSGMIINVTFTASSPAADKYLILRNANGTSPNAPANGTVYTTGENASLNAYVVYYGSNTTFENNYNHGIRGNNQYTYTVYAVNSNCMNGPLYNTQNPLISSIISCPASVNGITTSNVNTNSFDMTWSDSENGNALSINTVIEVASDSNFMSMVAGSPFTLGASALSQPISGLQPNTQYFIRGKRVSTQCQSSYSGTVSIYTTCPPTSSLYENFDSVSGANNLPNCWGKILTSNNGSTPTISLTNTEANSSPNNISFYGNGAATTEAATKIILVSPELTNINSGTHRLRFKAKRTSADIKIQIVALTGNTSSANVEIIETLPLTTTYQEYVVYLNNYSGAANHLGIRRVDGSTWSYMYVDDVIWEAAPSCTEITSVTLNEETYNGATISWTNVNNQEPGSGYEYFVSAVNTPPANTNSFVTLASGTHSVNLSGLSNGSYNFWIRRACSPGEKSPWKTVAFSTVPTTPAPWKEDFSTSAFPQGWTNGTSPQSFISGTDRGATGHGATTNNLYKNLFASTASGTFSTVNVGPLNTSNYELSFYYKQSSYNSPFAPLAAWGNFDVQISSDFGATWTTIGTVNNEPGTGNYIKKTYSLAAYQNQFVKVRINANRTAGDFDLSFDDFEIKAGNLSTLETVKDKIRIYPNPAVSFVRIDSKEKVKSFELYTISGQIVKTGGQVQEVSLENLVSGLYILRVALDNGQTVIHKIVKQ